jgi:hypothetical protein
LAEELIEFKRNVEGLVKDADKKRALEETQNNIAERT